MEYKKKLCLYGLLILLVLPIISATLDYTPSSNNQCDSKGECTFVQYSYIRYGIEDDNWKPIEDMRSLLGTGIEVQYIEDDPKYHVDVIDYNMTSITLKLDPAGFSIFSDSIPLKVWAVDESLTADKITGDFKQDAILTKDDSITFDLFKQSETTTLDAKFGDIIEFGQNSTTIVLNTTNGAILDDGYVDSASKTSNFSSGTGASVLISGTNVVNHAYFRFNTSAIPANINIDKANISLFAATNALDTASEGYNVSLYWVYTNYTFNASTMTWNNRPNLTRSEFDPVASDKQLFLGGASSFPTASARFEFLATYVINHSYLNGEKNSTFWFNASELFGSPANTDSVSISTKESPTVANRPILTITYTTLPGASCTYPGSGAWNINLADNCTLSSNVNLAGNNLIFNSTGTFVLNANITNRNQTRYSNETGWYIVFANGAILS